MFFLKQKYQHQNDDSVRHCVIEMNDSNGMFCRQNDKKSESNQITRSNKNLRTLIFGDKNAIGCGGVLSN
jgi:hypothetical protein